MRVGVNVFEVSFSDTSNEYKMETTALKVGISAEKMVKPFLLLGSSAFATITFGQPTITYTNDNFSDSATAENSRLNWRGFNLYLSWIR